MRFKNVGHSFNWNLTQVSLANKGKEGTRGKVHFNGEQNF